LTGYISFVKSGEILEMILENYYRNYRKKKKKKIVIGANVP